MDKEALIAGLNQRYAGRPGYRADLVERGVNTVVDYFSTQRATASESDSQPLSRRDSEADIDHLWNTENAQFQDEERMRTKLLGPLGWWAAAKLAYQMFQYGRFLYTVIRYTYDLLRPKENQLFMRRRRRL